MIHMQMKKLKFTHACLVLVLCLSFVVSYLFSYKMTQNAWTDLGIHVSVAENHLDGVETSSYPGFYLVYGFFTRICGMPQAHGAACAMGFFSVLTGLAVYVISGYLLGSDGTVGIKSLIVLFMNFFGPLYLGGGKYYLGQGSFNTWHNPTNSSVKFLALLCFFLFVYIYDMHTDERVVLLGKKLNRLHLYGILVLLTCFSLIFKPSFFQVFAPTLVAIYGLDFLMKKRSFKSCVFDALLFLPAIALILYQMLSEVGGGDSGGGMYIYFARGWSFHTDNIFRSIMTQAIFPLFVCIFCEKNVLKNKFLYHSVMFYLVGIGEGLFLVESGPRVSHGNFLWGNNIGIGVVYLASICVFVKYMQSNKHSKYYKTITCAGMILLSAQFLLGLNYILKCSMIPLEYF